MRLSFLIPIILFVLLTPSAFAKSEEGLVLQDTIPLANVEGRIDHMSFDADRNRLFIAALGNNTLEVIDLNLKKRIQTVGGFNEPQGVFIVSELKKVYVTNGGSDQIDILDSETLRKLSGIKLKEDVDNIRYDSKDKKIYVGSGESLFIIDAVTDKVVGQIALKGHPEAFELEKNGSRIFVNVPEIQKVQVLDRVQLEVVDEWSLPLGCSNFPMALDEGHERLFIGCRGIAKLLVVDSKAGHEIAQLSTGRDADDVFYDSVLNSIYMSDGDGVINIYKHDDKDHYEAMSAIQTALGARTSLYDMASKRLFAAIPHRGVQQPEIRIYTQIVY